MDLVESYVRAVAKALPQEQREDIMGELSEDIRSEMEDRQKALGRPLTEDEQESLLKQRGNPLLLAARYRQDQRSVAFGRQIIGPVLYPFYVKVLSFNLGLTFLIVGVIFTGLQLSGQRMSFGDIVSTCLLQFFIQFGVVTLIFSLVDRHLTKHPDRWQIKGKSGKFRLDLHIERNIQARLGSHTGEVSRFESLSIIVASAVALVWWTAVQSHPFLIFGPAAAFLNLAPIWHQIYFPIVVLTDLEIVRAMINLVRPDWTLFRATFRVILQAGGLAVVWFAISVGRWVTVANSFADKAGTYAQVAHIVNQCLLYVFVCAAILSAVTIVFRITELIRWRQRDTRPRGIGSTAKEGN
ncbi:MAG TPA: hypothetical protein VJW94_11610 [Candidatus Acidoferrum sp.]|nr:hypothetical protein [Candidatus Acidoferrum sp.]